MTCCAGGLKHLPGLRSLELHTLLPPDTLCLAALESLTLGGPNGAAVREWPDFTNGMQLRHLRLTHMHPAGKCLSVLAALCAQHHLQLWQYLAH